MLLLLAATWKWTYCGDEYFLRQVLGSVDYRSEGPISDFLQGYMGYQIEHHLWPDLPLSQYPRVRREVEALCAKYGVLYRRHSAWTRGMGAEQPGARHALSQAG